MSSGGDFLFRVNVKFSRPFPYLITPNPNR